MKKNYLLGIIMGLAVTAGVLSGSVLVQAASGDVKINSTNFPDANFRKVLKEEWYDANQNGVLSAKEIKNITSLHVSDEGIEFLVKLDYLDCDSNNLSKLDVSKNKELWYLDCSSNNLSKLDVSKNKELMTLICDSNNLSKLDVSKNVKLTQLYCHYNNLSKLDVSKNVKLERLSCHYNDLSKLDVSKNVKLDYLFCSSNNLSKLDVSKNKELMTLICDSNNLSKLDVNKNVKLEELSCDENNLSKLDVSKNKELGRLVCSSTNLSKLDVSKNEKLTDLRCHFNNLSKLDVSQNIYLNSLYCSGNRLACLKLLPNTGISFRGDNNVRYVPVNSSSQFDLSTLDGFNVKKAGNWKGGSVDGTILTFTSDKVTYTYDTGGYDSDNNKIKPVFTLVKCMHSGEMVKKTVKATFEKNGGVKTVCADCGKTIQKHETYYKMEQPKLSKASYTYNGEVKKPSVTVKDSKGNILKKDTDYTVSYASGRKNPGKYKVTIKGKGKYSGTVTKTFTIKPPKSAITSISSPEKKMLKIGYKKSSVVTGYQVYCSASKDFSKDTYKFGRKKSDENTLKISGLKSKKKYYVKIRTYKTVDDKKIYSVWSEVKSVKIK